MNIRPTKSFLRLWSLANVEAWFCQAATIEPAHFWLACLKLADPKIAAAMLDGGAAPEDCTEQTAEAGRILAYLEMDADAAAKRRRRKRRSRSGSGVYFVYLRDRGVHVHVTGPRSRPG